MNNQRPTSKGRQSFDQRNGTEASRHHRPQGREQVKRSDEAAGIIHSDQSRKNDPFREDQQIDDTPKVVLIIVVLIMVFIAIITYFITQMPTQ